VGFSPAEDSSYFVTALFFAALLMEEVLQSGRTEINCQSYRLREASVPKAKAQRRESLKKILEEQRRKLWRNLRGDVFGKLGDEYRREFERAMDAGDLSVVDLLESVDIKLVNMRQQELRRLEEAERKLNTGTYGICEECGTEIGGARLSAMPFSVRCVKCEEKLEGGEVRGKGPTL
jgi:DnaK suppressor protein